MKTIQVLTVSALAIAATALYAGQAGASKLNFAPVSHKLYVGAQLGFGEGAGNSDMGFAFGGDLGYRLNRNVAAELDFVRTPIGTNSHDDGNSFLFGATAKLSLPMTHQVDAFAKAGFGMVHNTVSTLEDTKAAFIFGAGADYAYSSDVSFTGQVLGSFGGNSDASTVAMLAGVSYAFN